LRLAKDHPDFVERLAVLDNIPTRVLFETLDGPLARGQWWFLFNALPNLPEALIAGREEIWLRHFFSHWSHDPQVMTPATSPNTWRAYQQPGAIMGACNDYRAGAEECPGHRRPRRQVRCRSCAVGRGLRMGGKAYDVAAIWRDRLRSAHGRDSRVLAFASGGTTRTR